MANTKTSRLKNIVGRSVVIKVKGSGYSRTVPVPKFDVTGFLASSANAYKGKEVNRCVNGLKTWLESLASNVDDSRYTIDESFVPEFLDRLAAANASIAAEQKAYVDHYDEHKEAFRQELIATCKGNRKVKYSKAIIDATMKRFPTAEQIRSGKIIYTIESPSDYEQLLEATRNLVDESREKEACEKRIEHINRRCSPVIENLVKFSHQILENSKLHGGTITSYNLAVENLMTANEREKLHLPELSEFVKISSYAVDYPMQSIDLLLMGFMRFYYTQGMLDVVPYDILDGYDRDLVESVGKDAENSFSAIAEKLPKQLSMF